MTPAIFIYETKVLGHFNCCHFFIGMIVSGEPPCSTTVISLSHAAYLTKSSYLLSLISPNSISLQRRNNPSTSTVPLLCQKRSMHFFLRSTITPSQYLLVSFISVLALARASSFYDNPEQDPLPDSTAQEWGGGPGDGSVIYGRETREELEARWGYDVGSLLFPL